MAIAVTSRGYQYLASGSSGNITFSAFQPAQNSLLLITVEAYDGIPNDIISSVSCDASWSVSTWTQLFRVPLGYGSDPVQEVWGAIVTGASPASAAVTVVQSGYHGKLESEIYEVTGVNVSGGTASSCIGVSVTDTFTDADAAAKSMTLSSFASASNGTFLNVFALYNANNITFEAGWTGGTERGSAAFARLRSGWIDSEDTSVTFTTAQWYASAIAFEIKAGGGAASIVPQAMANYRMRAA